MADNQGDIIKRAGEKTKSADNQTVRRKVKALKPSHVVNKKRKIYEFEGKWLELFGKPERIAKWFITGPPYSGKSSFTYELCEYLCSFGKLDYNSHEEGDSLTTAQKMEAHGLMAKDSEFKLLPKVPIEDMLWRLQRKNSAKFGVIDSLQHCGMKKRQYVDFTNALSSPRTGKSLLFISHFEKNDYTMFVKHDCDIKIEIVGFVAKIKSRYSEAGEARHVIWEAGAKKFWGKKYTTVIRGKYWPHKD